MEQCLIQMSRQDRGHHSRSDGPDENEKPMKKAKFLWEVKGKHHLKDSYKNININNNSGEPVADSTSNQPELDEKHIENCQKKEPCNCLQQFLSKSEDIMIDIEDELNSNQIEEDEYDFPLSLLGTNEKNQDYYLRKWQARQIARGFVDNTINSVLETWATRPSDVGDFVENCHNDGQVEDDAILMAIQEHGLQSRDEARDGSRLRFSSELKEQMAAILVKETSDNFSDLEEFGSSRQNEENLDFMNAAVSAAIEKKGLSYGF